MKAGKLGALSAVTASLCCLGPVALVAFGLGGLGLGVLFSRYAGILLVAATLLLSLGWWLYTKETRRCRQAQCQMPGRTGTFATLIVASTIVGAVALMHLWPLVNQACGAACPR